MSLPTVEQFLAKLEADPQAGRDFDAATRAERPHCKTRREACEHLLASLRAKTASVTASNEKKRQALLAQRDLEKAAAAMRNRRKTAPISKAPAPAPAAKAPTPASRPVSKALPASPITRSVFAKLTPAEKMAYIKTGGKLI
jgi:hypothetical protein